MLSVGVLGVQAVLGNKDPTVIGAEADEAKLDALQEEVQNTEFAIE